MAIPYASLNSNDVNQYRRKSCVPILQGVFTECVTEERPRSKSFSNGEKSPLVPSLCKSRVSTPFYYTPKMSFQTFSFDTPIDIIKRSPPSMFGGSRDRIGSKNKIRLTLAKLLFIIFGLISVGALMAGLFYGFYDYVHPNKAGFYNEPIQAFHNQKKYQELMGKSGKLLKFKPPEDKNLLDAEEEIDTEPTKPAYNFVARNIPTYTGKSPVKEAPPTVEIAGQDHSLPHYPRDKQIPHQFSYLEHGTILEMEPIKEIDSLRRLESRDSEFPIYKKQSMMKMLSNGGPGQQRDQIHLSKNQRRIPPGVNPHIYRRVEL